MSAAGGIAVTGLAQGVRLVLGFVSGVVLARLLRPEDFGLVALITPAVTLIGLVQDLGLNQATIQREKITDGQVSALLVITLGASAVLGGLLALSGPLLAAFYEEPRLVPLAVAFGALVVVWSAQSQPMALLARQMRFGAMAAIEIAALVAGLVAGIAVALATHSYWALFVSMLVTGVLSAVLSFALSGLVLRKPDLGRDLREILGFGSSVFAFNVFNYLTRNADNVLIGRFHGVVELGLYDRAYKLLLYPLQQIRNPLTRVMVPWLSRTRGDAARYTDGYLTCVTGLLVVTQPAILVTVMLPEAVFLLLLGPQWLGAAPIFAWLGIAGLQQVLTGTLGWLFLSQGRGRDYLILGAAQCVIILTAFVVGLPDGAVGVARAYALADTVLKMPLAFAIALRCGPVGWRPVIASLVPHTAALLAATAALFALIDVAPAQSFAVLVAATVTAYAVYGLVLALWPQKRRLGFSVAARAIAFLAQRLPRPSGSRLKEVR